MNTEDEMLCAWLNKHGYYIGSLAARILCWPEGCALSRTDSVELTDLDAWLSNGVIGRTRGALPLRPKGGAFASFELRACARLWVLGLSV